MALGEFVYPPILSSSQPAYNIEDDLIINFTIPSMVSINDIGAIGITIVSQSNNTSVLLNSEYLYFDFNNSSEINNILNNDYSIEIKTSYFDLNKYIPGKLFKIQMNFGKSFWDKIPLYDKITEYENYTKEIIENSDISWTNKTTLLDNAIENILKDYPTLVKNIHYIPVTSSSVRRYWQFKKDLSCLFIWETGNNFSEWSSVMLIKPITIPELTIGLPNERGILADKFKDTSVEVIYVERSLNPLFTGTCIFSQPNENEVEDQYKFFLYENNQLISETDWLTHKANETNDQYSFDQMLKENTYYSVGYQIKTNNGYISDIKQKSFIIELPDLGKLEGVTLRTEPYSEDGYMNVYLNSSQEIQSNFILSRAAENTNFQKWENLGYITNYLQIGDQLVYQDYTVESGIKYLYTLTEEIRYDDYSEYKSPLYEGEEGKLDISKAKSVDFEYAFLYSKGKQLKLKFNNKMSSFKKSVLASKQDTIGSQYPTILRNGQAYYAEFPITGLISLQMDDNQTFFTLGEEGYYYDDELIIPKDKLQNRNYRESTNTDQSCSPWTNTDLVDDNIFIERKFREKVEEFLNNGECKLYRSPTEGNFIINLLNISFTPNQTLGRMIYEFNSTAYEIDEVNIKNLEKLDILNLGQYKQILKNQFLEKTISSTKGLFIYQEDLQQTDSLFFKSVSGSPFSLELLTQFIDENGEEKKKNSIITVFSDFTYKINTEFYLEVHSSIDVIVQIKRKEEFLLNQSKIKVQKSYLNVRNNFDLNNSTYYSLKTLEDAVKISLIQLTLENGDVNENSSLSDLFDSLNNKQQYYLIHPITSEIYNTKDSLKDNELSKYLNKIEILNKEENQNVATISAGGIINTDIDVGNIFSIIRENKNETMPSPITGSANALNINYEISLAFQEVI